VVCEQAKTPHPPQAKGGHGGKGPIEKQSREEKTKGGKEQEEERPDPVGIRARTNDWERRFRQEVLVTQSASIPRRKVRSDELIRAFSLSLTCRYGHSVYRGSMSIKGEQQARLTALYIWLQARLRKAIDRAVMTPKSYGTSGRIKDSAWVREVQHRPDGSSLGAKATIRSG
jgi:hypothetical protein